MNPVSDGNKMPATLIPGDGIGLEIVDAVVSAQFSKRWAPHSLGIGSGVE
jgi:hypothetical protein